MNIENTATAGGNEDVVYTLPDVPGFSLTVKAGSVTFPDGSKQGQISVTQVHADKVPMAPPNGLQPRFIVTIQPPGAIFDPPAPVTLPNVDGLAPGEKTNLYSFDHDLGEFVSIGTGTVSEDGMLIVSDPGVGVVKAGWHCGGNPQASGSADNCPECQECEDDDCVPVSDGSGCTDDGRFCTKDICKGGGCNHPPKPDGTPVPDEECKECKGGNVANKPDSPTIPTPADSSGPGATQVNTDAVAAGAWGENTGFDYDLSVTCEQLCVNGEEKYGIDGDVTPSAGWQVLVYTKMKASNCAEANRTAANIQRTTTHELKHTGFLISVINDHKSSIGAVHDTEAACNQAITTLSENLESDWEQMVNRQAAHTDFSGEQRYGVDCQGGVTVEVPTTLYP